MEDIPMGLLAGKTGRNEGLRGRRCFQPGSGGRKTEIGRLLYSGLLRYFTGNVWGTETVKRTVFTYFVGENTGGLTDRILSM